MLTLGIETSCDETSFAVLKNGRKVLSNVIVSSIKEHKEFGGVVPEIASRAHLETLLACLKLSLEKAKVTLQQIDLIAVTRGPGLMGSLLVGLSSAKALSMALKKPLIGVDHVIAHVYSGVMSNSKLKFPFLGLAVSGGHTLLIEMKSPSRYEILGRTIDDAAGEAFDKVAKMLGLGYPGGPEIDRLSRGEDTNRFFFTRPILSEDSLDFSFSGIKTAVFYKVENLKKKKPLSIQDKKALCAGFQESVCDVLVQKSVRAAQSRKLKAIVVGGGVSANSRLRALFAKAGRRENLKIVFPEMSFCQDNAAMIAGLGAALYREGHQDGLGLSAYSDFPLTDPPLAGNRRGN